MSASAALDVAINLRQAVRNQLRAGPEKQTKIAGALDPACVAVGAIQEPAAIATGERRPEAS